MLIVSEADMSLKLIYFKMRALAEAPQMLLHFADIEYEYIMSWDHFDDVWSNVKPMITFKQLPILVTESGAEIAQSAAILNYIQDIAGLTPKDPVQAAQANAILLSAQELFAPLNPTVNFAVGDEFRAKAGAMRAMLLSRFDDLDRALVRGGSQFFTGNEPIACDFAAFHHLDLSRLLDAELLTGFQRLKQFLEDIAAIPSIAAYLEARPALTDVSIAPKLMIDGQAHPTGTQQT